VNYEYVNVVVANLDDELLLAGENRVGFVLYAAKRAAKCGGDDGKKFRYLREITVLWAQRGWPAEEKRIILLAIEHLLRLDSEYYVNQFVEHMETLTESLKEEKDMYVSAFERVYTARGREQGLEEGLEEGMEKGIVQGMEKVARNMLSDGMPVDKVTQYTNLPREKIEALLN
jgi:predicted transposase/invertase (TIGR01784 family)